MRILSSAEKRRRVAGRIFFTTCVAGSFSGFSGFPSHLRSLKGYDEPEILPSSTRPICLMSADGGHSAVGAHQKVRLGLLTLDLAANRLSSLDREINRI